MKNPQKGSAALWIIILVLIIIAGGIYYYSMKSTVPAVQESSEDQDSEASTAPLATIDLPSLTVDTSHATTTIMGTAYNIDSLIVQIDASVVQASNDPQATSQTIVLRQNAIVDNKRWSVDLPTNVFGKDGPYKVSVGIKDRTTGEVTFLGSGTVTVNEK